MYFVVIYGRLPAISTFTEEDFQPRVFHVFNLFLSHSVILPKQLIVFVVTQYRYLNKSYEHYFINFRCPNGSVLLAAGHVACPLSITLVKCKMIRGPTLCALRNNQHGEAFGTSPGK